MIIKKPRIFFVVTAVVAVFSLIFFAGLAGASTNISATTTDHWGWNDIVGWIDFFNTSNITVTSQKLTGYASSSAGDISLDCATTRNNDICSTSNYKVSNDGNGNLSGWGWNDAYGWISFYCGNHNGCGSSNYRVLITNGIFSGYAWNDVVGWVSFNCAGPPDQCGTSDYRVVTSWVSTSSIASLDSSTFDTGVSSGAQLNSILWQGLQPAGTSVGFQIAASANSTGPWNYKGPLGTADDFYVTDPGVSKSVSYTLHNNARYFRYRVKLTSDQAQTLTPRVDDIIVNWSR